MTTRNEQLLNQRIERLEFELNELRGLLNAQPVDYGRPTGGGSIKAAVAREFTEEDPLGLDEELLCSILSFDSAGKVWQIPSAEKVKLKVWPELIPAMYEAFLFPGTGAEVFPFNVLPGTVVLPVFNLAGRATIMHHSNLFYGEIEEGAPVTEGFLVNGIGEVTFGNIVPG